MTSSSRQALIEPLEESLLLSEGVNGRIDSALFGGLSQSRKGDRT